jgi:hypothetical protein
VTTAACTSTRDSQPCVLSHPVALGGFAWDKAGRIWYATLRDSRLSTNAQFADFANLTVDNAGKLFGAAEREAVFTAWVTVGVLSGTAGQSSDLSGATNAPEAAG